jgi:hypothetical protein
MPRVTAIPEKSARFVRSQKACGGGAGVLWTVANTGVDALPLGWASESRLIVRCAVADCGIKHETKTNTANMTDFHEDRVDPCTGISTL